MHPYHYRHTPAVGNRASKTLALVIGVALLVAIGWLVYLIVDRGFDTLF